MLESVSKELEVLIKGQLMGTSNVLLRAIEHLDRGTSCSDFCLFRIILNQALNFALG